MERSGLEEYNFIKSIIKLLKPKKVLEIGTSDGFGTIQMANMMDKGGELWTIDIEDKRNKDLINYRGKTNIKFIKGDSNKILKELVNNNIQFDLIFIDGNHHYTKVKEDWENSKRMSKFIVLHDAIQFKGVYRLLSEIKNTNEWDVVILKYPGITLYDSLTKKYYFASKCPGIAIITKKENVYFENYLDYLEHPTFYSQKLLNNKRELLKSWINRSVREELNSFDIIILFNIVWNFQPEVIVEAGSVGTSSTLVFLDYCIDNNVEFIPYAVSPTFWLKYKNRIDLHFFNKISTVFISEKDESKFLNRILPFLESKKIFFWINELGRKFFYDKTLKWILEKMNNRCLCCIKNFSPFFGEPNRIVVGKAQCTNMLAKEFCDWLNRQNNFSYRLASPEATFGDYVNAGHWLLVKKT